MTHSYYLGPKHAEYTEKVNELMAYHAAEIIKTSKQKRLTGALAYRHFIDKLYQMMLDEIVGSKEKQKELMKKAVQEYLNREGGEISD